MAPEGLGAYPRWQGELKAFPSWAVVAGEEIRRAWRHAWAQAAIFVAFAYAMLYIGGLYTISRGQADTSSINTLQNFLSLIDLERWAGLGIAAIMSGSALLEDDRRGALELYLSRAVTRVDYLLGKIIAVLGMTTLVVVGPALLYWAADYAIFTTQPPNWIWIPVASLGYGFVWAVLVAGLGLGLASVSRSSRAASLLLFGGVAALDIVVSTLLSTITNQPWAKILSPFQDHVALHSFFFQTAQSPNFPDWWGAAAVLGLAIVGWGLVAWRHPRLFRGVD